MLKYAGKYGIPYLDFNQKLKELGIDWKSDTLDKGDHLNLSGAHKVTDYMTMYLQEHYMLPDHRGDEENLRDGIRWQSSIQRRQDIRDAQ